MASAFFIAFMPTRMVRTCHSSACVKMDRAWRFTDEEEPEVISLNASERLYTHTRHTTHGDTVLGEHK